MVEAHPITMCIKKQRNKEKLRTGPMSLTCPPFGGHQMNDVSPGFPAGVALRCARSADSKASQCACRR